MDEQDERSPVSRIALGAVIVAAGVCMRMGTSAVQSPEAGTTPSAPPIEDVSVSVTVPPEFELNGDEEIGSKRKVRRTNGLAVAAAAPVPVAADPAPNTAVPSAADSVVVSVIVPADQGRAGTGYTGRTGQARARYIVMPPPEKPPVPGTDSQLVEVEPSGAPPDAGDATTGSGQTSADTTSGAEGAGSGQNTGGIGGPSVADAAGGALDAADSAIGSAGNQIGGSVSNAVGAARGALGALGSRLGH